MSGLSTFLMNAMALAMARFKVDSAGNSTLVGIDGKRLGPAVYINPGLTAAQVNARITAAFGTMSAPTGGTLIFNAGIHDTYESSIQIPYNVSVLCEPGCEFRPPLGASYTQGFLFLVNTTDGLNWTVAYTNRQGAFFDGARLNNIANYNTVTAKLVCLGAPHMVRNISGRFVHGMVWTTNNYMDGFTIDGWSCAYAQGSDYQIRLTGLGDGLRIRGGGCGNSNVGGSNGIALYKCQGGTILGQIGGGMYFFQCRSVIVDATHIEEADSMVIEDSDVTFNDSFIWKHDVTKGSRIKLTGTARRTCVLNNVQFMFNMNHVITPGFDVQTTSNKDLVINNCRSVVTKQDAIGTSQQYGITICESDGVTPLAIFSAYSYLLSHRSIIRESRVLGGFERVLCAKYTLNMPAIQSTTDVVWREATGTYYYHAQAVFDAARKLGSSFGGTEKVISPTNGGSGVLVPLGNSPICFIRLYRGTVPGSYDKYVDLPQMQAGYMYDDGVVVAGFPWKTRTAGAMDALQDLIALDIRPTNAIGSTRVRVVTTAMPSAGSFQIGDSCEIDAPSPSNVASYRYTSGGWKAETTLAA